jgi:hypothetical protein
MGEGGGVEGDGKIKVRQREKHDGKHERARCFDFALLRLRSASTSLCFDFAQHDELP